jgi:hypothetical protein
MTVALKVEYGQGFGFSVEDQECAKVCTISPKVFRFLFAAQPLVIFMQESTIPNLAEVERSILRAQLPLSTCLCRLRIIQTYPRFLHHSGLWFLSSRTLQFIFVIVAFFYKCLRNCGFFWVYAQRNSDILPASLVLTIHTLHAP